MGRTRDHPRVPRLLRLRVRPWGDALAVLLPDPVADEEGLAPGDVVEVTVRKPPP